MQIQLLNFNNVISIIVLRPDRSGLNKKADVRSTLSVTKCRQEMTAQARYLYKSIEYSLCSFSQWPSANAGCMNVP